MGNILFLRVGCADCTIIQSANDTFLVDCAENIALYPALLPADHRITAVFITHQHYDHFKGLKYLIENDYYVNYLIYSPYKRRFNDYSVREEEWKDFNSFRNNFEQKGTQLFAPFRQENLDEPRLKFEDIEFYILGPDRYINHMENRELHEACLVILIVSGEAKFIFPGDANDKCLNRIAINPPLPCVDILLASHHGSLNGADIAFLQKVNPNYTIISTQEGGHHNFPDPIALARYHQYTRTEIYRTDQNPEDGILKFTW